MTTLSAPWIELSVSERAAEAWGASAELESKRAVDSLRGQAMRKLKLRSEDYELSPDYFDDEVQPHLRVAGIVDGITLCLDAGKALAAMVWECAESGCMERWRCQVDDYSSLGSAIELGRKEQDERPHCRAHKKKGERL